MTRGRLGICIAAGSKEIPSVKNIIADELEQTAVKIVQTRFAHNVDYGTGLAPEFRSAGRLLDVELLNGVDGIREDTFTIHTTPDQDRLIQDFINNRTKNPGLYHLTGRNCSEFVHDALAAGGINLGNTAFPRTLMQELHSMPSASSH